MKKISIFVSIGLLLFMVFAGCKTIEQTVQDAVEKKVEKKVEKELESTVEDEVSDSVFGNYAEGAIPFISPNMGRPKIEEKEGPAYFIWKDDKGWHVRVKPGDKLTVFTGNIKTTSKITIVTKI